MMIYIASLIFTDHLTSLSNFQYWATYDDDLDGDDDIDDDMRMMMMIEEMIMTMALMVVITTYPDTHRPPDLIIIFSRFWAAGVVEGGDGRGLLRDEEHLLQP